MNKHFDNFYTYYKNCLVCKALLSGKQRKYCSLYCKNQVNRTQKRRLNKMLAITMLGGECRNCGYNKCNAALELHHVNPINKTPMNDRTITDLSDKLFLMELSKCVLLCANCHREAHYSSVSEIA